MISCWQCGHSLAESPSYRCDNCGAAPEPPDESEALAIATQAIKSPAMRSALCTFHRYRRAVYPFVLKLLHTPEVLEHVHHLDDSRLPFDLLRLHRATGDPAVLAALQRTRDPRFTDAPPSKRRYTFRHSDEDARVKLRAAYLGFEPSERSKRLGGEIRNDLAQAIFVLVDSTLVLAPWSSEHVVAASGGTGKIVDVEAAGEVAFDPRTWEAAVLTNYSGGYWPHRSSLDLIRGRLPEASDLQIVPWPRDGYLDDDFIQANLT